MFRMFRRFRSARDVHLLLAATVSIGVLVPRPASAQQSDSWKGTFAPLYLWATRIDGEIATRAGTTPVFMTFDDAAENLAGAFSFHFEAEKNRLGVFGDLNFVRLSTESTFTLQGPLATQVEGDVDVDNTFFEAGGSYRLSEITNVAVIGGLRTFTLSNKIEFSTTSASLTPVDASRTAVSAFAGITFRPALSEKVSLLSRADVGGGSGMSWSAMLGVEFRPKPWAGLVLGYKGSGIEFGKETDDTQIRKVDLTYYGPVFALNLHWGGR
jgi:hypothetical protein